MTLGHCWLPHISLLAYLLLLDRRHLAAHMRLLWQLPHLMCCKRPFPWSRAPWARCSQEKSQGKLVLPRHILNPLLWRIHVRSCLPEATRTRESPARLAPPASAAPLEQWGGRKVLRKSLPPFNEGAEQVMGNTMWKLLNQTHNLLT